MFELEFFINEWHIFTWAEACVFLLFTANIRAHSLYDNFSPDIAIIFFPLFPFVPRFSFCLLANFRNSAIIITRYINI